MLTHLINLVGLVVRGICISHDFQPDVYCKYRCHL